MIIITVINTGQTELADSARPGDSSVPNQNNTIHACTGPDLQTKAWVGHCACVVEIGLATYSIAKANQKAVLA